MKMFVVPSFTQSLNVVTHILTRTPTHILSIYSLTQQIFFGLTLFQYDLYVTSMDWLSSLFSVAIVLALCFSVAIYHIDGASKIKSNINNNKNTEKGNNNFWKH